MPDARLYAGFTTLEAGMDGGKDASLIPPNQVAASCNFTFRDALAKTRPPFAKIPLFDPTGVALSLSGLFQGAMFYAAETGNSGFILSIGGVLYRIEMGTTNIAYSLSSTITTDPTAELIYPFQAENYAIILGNQYKTLIYDGTTIREAQVGELPPGVVGIYAWGRIWIALSDRRSFIAGDLIYGPSGSALLRYRDAILKVTENTFLNEGGTFSVPNNAGPITAMFALATQDTSLGIGPVLVGTTNSVISVNAPVDRTIWKNLEYPIQTISLLDYGPQGPRNLAGVNGDQWYRAVNELRSFIVARRDINVWGNTPVSQEVSPILDGDSKDLLFYGSSMFFDNKLFSTVSPYRTTSGIAHRGLVAINFDLVSDLRQKGMPAWEGAYTGVQVLQVVKGTINNEERGFAFVLCNGKIELWEILTEGYYDEYTRKGPTGTEIDRSAIQSFLITRREDFGLGSNLLQLYTAEIFLDQMVDTVTLTVSFRPDEYPAWTTWATMSFCSPVTQCSIPQTGATCEIFQTNAEQYAARVMLPLPPEAPCNIMGNRQISLGYSFQFKIEVTGHCRIRKFRPHAKVQTDKMVGECPATPVCEAFPNCDTDWFSYEVPQPADYGGGIT